MNASADEVETVLRRALSRADDEDELLRSFQNVADADTSWTQRFWDASEAAYDVASSQPVSAITNSMCDGLETLIVQQRWEEAVLRASASQTYGLPADHPDVVAAANASALALGWHEQGSAAYTEWVRSVTCVVSNLP